MSAPQAGKGVFRHSGPAGRKGDPFLLLTGAETFQRGLPVGFNVQERKKRMVDAIRSQVLGGRTNATVSPKRHAETKARSFAANTYYELHGDSKCSCPLFYLRQKKSQEASANQPEDAHWQALLIAF